MESRASRSVLRTSCVAFCVAVALPVFATTYYVDAEKGDDGYDGLAPESAFKSFAYAVSQLPNSSTLVFAKGRYEMTNSVEKALKGCTFRGATGVREDVVLDGCGKYRILRVNSVSPASRTTFESLSVVNAYSDHETQKGGALSIASDDLWITNCVFSSCTNLKTGCSVAVAGTEVKVFDSLFTNNAAVAGAELLNANAAGAGGHAVLYRSRFVDNVANGQAIMGQGNGPWGAAYDCTFERNANLLDGGGVFSGHVTMVSNCTFIANSAKGGGGVWGSGNVTESVFSYVDCRFVGNSSAGSGGVFSTSKHLLDLVRCSFTSNTAISGGVVSSSAQLYRVLDCAFTNNFCEVIGGASGGAISASSIGLLSGTTFVSNYIHSTGANPGHNTTAGGAICLTKNSTLSYTVDGKDYDLPHIISNCTFVGNYNVQDKRADNQSTARGGAIAFGSGDTAEGSANPSDYKVVDCRFEGNYLRTDSGYNNLDAGGAIYAVNGLRLYGTAFVGNSTVSGGGAFAGYAPVISNCTFVGNSAVYAVPNLTSKAGTGGAVVLFSEPWDDHTSGVYQVVADCLFASNSIAGTTGSAFVLAQGHLKMSDCTFVGNHAVGNGETYSGSYGGTLALDVGRVPLVGNMNSHWRQGKNTTKDPALSVEYVEIDRCTFSGNVSEGLGGAIYCCDEPAAIPSPSPVVRLRNSLFIDNMATNCPASSGATAAKGRGGALHYQKQQMDIANCTFVRNSAQGLGNNSYGGAINATGTNTGITNCVFYGNWHDKTSDEGRTVKLPQTVDYDVIAYCYLPDTPSSHFKADPAWHNIISNDDPFRSDDHTDLAVKKDCGAGVGLNTLDWMVGARDLGGKPRLAADDTVDFGCYQFWRKPGLLLFVQ